MTTSTSILPPQPRNIRQVKQLQQASRRLLVVPRDPDHGRYLVASARDSGRYYQVVVQRDGLSGHCTCPWAQYGGINCKHVLAALRAEYESWGALSFWPTSDEARRQHRHVLRGERLYATLRPRRRHQREYSRRTQLEHRSSMSAFTSERGFWALGEAIVEAVVTRYPATFDSTAVVK